MFTFLLRYRGAEACSQYKAKNVLAALRKWAKEELDKLSYEAYEGERSSMLTKKQVAAMRDSVGIAEFGTLVQVGAYSGIQNVWHIGMRVTYQTYAHLYIVKTATTRKSKT